MSSLREGGTIGAYQLVRELGAGGMGAVWLAKHTMLGRQAAIKVLHDSFATQPEIVTRFFNEARAATAISDPGIVQIYDFGQHTDGTAYIVMEMLSGESLETRLRRQHCLAVGDTVRLMRQVASSLGAAHEHGIIHRDLKPDNIFIVSDMEVAGGERTKLLDFGIAKLTGEGSGIKTSTSAVMGTPVFMSPEQCRGAGHVDQRSDIYSLGCVMFQLLAGRPPFIGEGVGDLIIMHVTAPPPELAQFAPGVPPAVAALVARCLAKDPQHRPASGRALAMELGALADSLPQLGLAARSQGMPQMGYVTGTGPTAHPGATMPTGLPGAGPTTLSAAAGARSQPSVKRRPLGIAIGIAAVLAVGGVTAVMATRGSGTTSEGSDPPVRPATQPATPVPSPAPAPAAAPAPVVTPVPAAAAASPPTPALLAPPPPAVAPPTAPIKTPSVATPKVKTKRVTTAAAPPVASTPAAAAAPAPSTPPPASATPVEQAPIRDDDFKKRLEEQRKRATRPTQVKPVD